MARGPMRTLHEHVDTNTFTSEVFRDTFKILNVHIQWTASADTGNRRIQFLLYLKDGHTAWDSRSDANQAASTNRHYSLAAGFPRETSFSGNDDLYLPIPEDLIITEGMYIKVWDSANISATDTFHVTMQYEEI